MHFLLLSACQSPGSPPLPVDTTAWVSACGGTSAGCLPAVAWETPSATNVTAVLPTRSQRREADVVCMSGVPVGREGERYPRAVKRASRARIKPARE